MGVFAALLAALEPEQAAAGALPGTVNAGLFAQLSLSEGELAETGGDPRPDLAALLGSDVEVTVSEGEIAAAAAIEATIAAAGSDPLTGTAETSEVPGTHETVPAVAAQTPPATPPLKQTGLDKAAAKTADKPGAEGVGNALGQGNRADAVTDAPATPPQAASPLPAAPVPQAGAEARPAAPADPLKALHDAVAKPAHANGDGDGEDAADGPDPAAGAGDKRPAPSPLNRPVLVHAAPQPLTAQTIVTVQESPSADTIPLGATGGAAQTVQMKTVSAPPPPTPGANPVPLNGIAVHIAQQAQTGARRFDIRLDPPELGRIEVRLEVNREGHVHTHLVVERSETLDLLQRDARQLERALQDAGLDTSQGGMKFSLKEHGAGQQDARDNGFGNSSGAGGEPAAESAEEPVWQGRAYTATGGLDIRI
ncbi:MAG: flagellar hook-length control protein FliK [Hyphomicrobiales bacterium]